MNDLSEKEKIIQEQAKLTEGKRNEGSSDALNAKDREIIAAAGNLEEKERAYAEIAKRLDDTEALSTRAMKILSEKQKIIQEQAKN